jgi:NAD(P)-dependent dehydrogenase (short-subunit alcohol dehydrogenase family)
VFASDLNPLPEPEASSIPFHKVDVTSWKEQIELFKAAEKEYGRIDHVFANAGISPSFSLLEDDVDEHGDLLPPNPNTLNVNLNGCVYTVKLGIYYLKKNPKGGSIVMTASGSSFTRFPATDYSAQSLSILDNSPKMPQQPRNTPSSAFCALSMANCIPDCQYVSTPLRLHGPILASYQDISSPPSVKTTTSPRMLLVAL